MLSAGAATCRMASAGVAAGDEVDVAPADAQVAELAVGKAGQLVIGLTVLLPGIVLANEGVEHWSLHENGVEVKRPSEAADAASRHRSGEPDMGCVAPFVARCFGMPALQNAPGSCHARVIRKSLAGRPRSMRRLLKKSERPPEGGEPAGVAISERGWEEDAPPGHVKEIGEEVYLFERELLTAGALGDETNVAACNAEIVELTGGKPRKLRNSALVGPPVAVGASKCVEHDSLCVHVLRELAARLVRRQRSDPMTKR